MNLNFTKLIAIVCFLLVTIGLSAQNINNLEITAPASIAGNYIVASGTFGVNNNPPLTGDLLLIEDDTDPTSDGCTAAVNDLTGFFALVDRGACDFFLKATNAQAAGATAIIICNNVTGNILVEPGLGEGVDASAITMPVVGMSFDNCATIRAEFGNQVSGILNIYEVPCIVECDESEYPENTVWGQNGEGSFACGLGDWSTLGLSSEANTWVWDADGTSPNFGTWLSMSAESSACDGVALMNYAGYNTTGSTGEFHTSELISPEIDLTGVNNPILYFTSANLALNDSPEFQTGTFTGAYWNYSLDGGETWSDYVTLESNNQLTNLVEDIADGVLNERFILQEAANAPSLRLKFTGSADFYFWMIDNVYITNEEISEVLAFGDWFAGAPNFKTPSSQVDELAFMIDINNVGNVDFDNCSFDATVTKDGVELHTVSSGDLGPVAATSNLENTIIPTTWPMSDELGLYTVTYDVQATGAIEDEDPTNNSVSSSFMVTESTFSKMRSEEEAGEFMVGLGQDATYVSYANGYYITNGDGELVPTSLTTGFETDIYTDFGYTTLTGEVYQWLVDSNADGIANLGTETALLARGQVLLNPDDPIDLRNIVIDLTQSPAFTAPFVAEGQYLAVVHVAPLTPPTVETFMAPLTSGFVDNGGNKDYFFAPSNFAFAGLGEALGRPASLSDFEGAAGTPTDQGARNLDPADGSALSWNITMEVGVISSTVDIDETIDLSIFPNPAVNSVTVDLNLTEVSKAVNVQIVDISGKVLSNNNFTNVKDSKLNVNTTDLTSGVYMINVFTDNGVKSERILIQK